MRPGHGHMGLALGRLRAPGLWAGRSRPKVRSGGPRLGTSGRPARRSDDRDVRQCAARTTPAALCPVAVRSFRRDAAPLAARPT